MNLRPEMARQTKQFEAETPMGRMATVDEFGRAGHLFVEPSGILLHGVDLIVGGGFLCWCATPSKPDIL
jgi:hypothetical protein